MSQFERCCIPAKEVQVAYLEGESQTIIDQQPQYGPYSSVVTDVEGYTTEITLAGLDRALGSRITRLLLQADAEQTLQVAALTLASHAKSRTPYDLQANLLINIVKEIAQGDEESPFVTVRHGEDLIRRCTLDNGMKHKIQKTLFDDGAIHNSPLVHLTMD